MSASADGAQAAIEAAITGVGRPLEGVRVLSMEQAAALPFATRHLADLGAEVIRVEAPNRAPRVVGVDLFRNKRRVALDLSQEAGPEAFRHIAAGCDVVAHNFTPRVMRKFGIDYAGIKAVRDDVIYVSLTGFGTTGPWGERPLFGPGAEAVSGQNNLIGEADAWPGRPGTIVYADNICGLHALTAILGALERRGRTGKGQHIDISLYETADQPDRRHGCRTRVRRRRAAPCRQPRQPPRPPRGLRRRRRRSPRRRHRERRTATCRRARARDRGRSHARGDRRGDRQPHRRGRRRSAAGRGGRRLGGA